MKEPIGILARWPCDRCKGEGDHIASWPPNTRTWVRCQKCDGQGVVDEPMPLATLRELLRPKRRSSK